MIKVNIPIQSNLAVIKVNIPIQSNLAVIKVNIQPPTVNTHSLIVVISDENCQQQPLEAANTFMFDMFVIPNKTFKKRIPKIKEMMVKVDDATGRALGSEDG